MKKLLSLCLALAALAVIPAYADDDGDKAASKEASVPKEESSATHHSVSVAGDGSVAYTATAGNLLIRNDKDEAVASMFYVAYTKDGDKDLSHRPVTFIFNGGPGSASIWLHMGSFAPVRVATPDAGYVPPAARSISARRPH